MKIALLATGDELISGDILNTNGQTIAQTLFDVGFQLGLQLTSPDSDADITKALAFLAKSHEVIIITGGLGPTSDDRTRFALSKATNLPLLFCDETWDAIVQRIQRYKFNLHPANRQQAYFPEGAKVLPNTNGTAAGCLLIHNNTHYFMLPGPPKECLPMFHEQVLPYLLTNCQDIQYSQKKWRLFGVSEGEIAAELDNLVKNHPVTTGYRWDYPYLEFKILYETTKNVGALIETLEKRIFEISICSAEKTAFELFTEHLVKQNKTLNICDNATRGLLQHRLSHTKASFFCRFVEAERANFVISGLQELWQDTNTIAASHTSLSIDGEIDSTSIHESFTIPFRSRQVVDYAIELISYNLLRLLKIH